MDGIHLVPRDSVGSIELSLRGRCLGIDGQLDIRTLRNRNISLCPGAGCEGGENGKTPDDKVIVFTYKVVANKVTKNSAYDASKDPEKTGIDSDGHKEFIPLEGAGFTLYKKNASGEYVAVGSEVKGGEMTTFTWTGLDDGDYKISETTTPDGYNTAADIEFTITAAHDVLSTNPTLTSLSGGNKFTGEVNTGVITTDIQNNKGSTLPETGGMGTTLFYVLGGALVLCAGVLLVTKKRMSARR